MALSLLAGFAHVANTVLPLNPPPPVPANTLGISLRVASQQAGTLGTLTAAGNVSAPTFALHNAPSFVSLAIDSTGLVCTIMFGSAAYQPTPYGFYVQATDGSSTAYFPIFMEVRTPLSLAAAPALVPNLTVSGSTATVMSSDSTVPDIAISGVGLFGATVAGVKFALPDMSSLPGMSWVTSDESKL